jgi:DnaJ-domain-containing protein 1
MIKRLFQIAKSNFGYYLDKKNSVLDEPPIIDPVANWDQFNRETEYESPKEDLFAKYFANLELPTNANRKEVKASWKRLMKKYHPDLHSIDPQKRKIATELSQGLTEAYKILDKELAKRETL